MTFTATVFQYGGKYNGLQMRESMQKLNPHIMWFSYPWGPIIMYPAGNFSQRPYAE